ncbi:MAG: peptidyl-prolyl cis-trans isomerase [Vicinamibacterales bacterium]
MNKHRLVHRVIFLGAVLAAAGVARAQVIEQILVKVNGEVFSKTDLEDRQAITLRQRGQAPDLKSASSDLQLRRLLDDMMPQLMVDAINEMVIVQRGKELGYTLSDEQFKKVLDDIKKENKLDTEEQFQAALKNENLTLVDLRRNLERQMIYQRVQQTEVLGRVGVTDEEARKYYDSHLSEFTTPATVTLREILIAIPADARGTNVAADEAAKARAEQIRSRVKAGEDFEQLVGEASEAPSRASGGLVTGIRVSDLTGELRQIVEALKIGEVSDVLRTTRGYQLLKLEASTPTEILSFEQARDRISDRVFTDKRKEELLKYMDKLRSQAIIEWKNPDVKKAFDEGLKQQAVGGPQSAAGSQ